MSNFTKEITSIDIEEELKRSYLDYAMSVIIGRALPDVRDGLKPVHRRVLFAMSMLNNDWNKSYKKSARIVGDVIGKYHPHGDTAVYDAIVRMAQPFSLRYTLIDGQGNFGSIDGDPAAAMRYTEIRMARITHELLADLEKETVDYTLNYDGTEKIPNVMPTRIPNLLINGSSGIAVGMATNIPPHNLTEVINGCLSFIKNENISTEDLMKHIPGPDFPTGAIVHGKNGIEEAYRTGCGKIYIRARTRIEKDNKTGKESIIISEIPYQVNKSRLVEKIAELVREKKIDGISGLRDESDKDGMRIVIEVKRDAIVKVILNNLYSLTKLQTSFTINMVALHQGQPKKLSLKEVLSTFIHHRKEVVTRRIIFELRKLRERIHILEALVIALTNIDLIIGVIRKSSNPIEARDFLIFQSWKIDSIQNLINQNFENYVFLQGDNVDSHKKIKDGKYYLTEKQAKAVLDLSLQKLTRLEYNKLFDEYKYLLRKINECTLILKDKNQLMRVICEELNCIKKQYNDPRRTKIVKNSLNIRTEDLILQENVVVTFSYQGYVKYQPITDYEAQKRGGKGKSATSIKEEDFIDHLLVVNTHDTILLFSSQGRIFWTKVYQLPEASRSARGKPIVNLIPLNSNERITAILPVHKYEDGRYIFMATSKGIVKKISLIEFYRPRNTGIIAINLNEDDQLIGVDLTDGNNEIMLFSAYGKVVRFSENQVRSMGRNASGVRGISLAKGDKVVSLIVPHSDQPILTVTQHGYGKRTNQSEYPVRSRATHGVISMKVNERNGEVVEAIQVSKQDQIMIITDAGTLVRIRVSEISIVGRNTHGVTLIRTSQGEKVVGAQKITDPQSVETLI